MATRSKFLKRLTVTPLNKVAVSRQRKDAMATQPFLDSNTSPLTAEQ